MEVEISKSFYKKLTSRIEGFEFEVGILQDKQHFEPIFTGLNQPPQTTSYAGGPVRKKSRDKSELTTGEILVANMKRLGKNLLSDPFRDQGNQDIVKFAREFLKFVISNRSNKKRVENLLQAIVRNPILRGDYGNNKASTADAKGFDRHMFDTGQMFKLITAKAQRVKK